MAIQDIKSKINDNKQEKERKLLNTALHLFTEKGIKKTSIQDIVHEAGIAKGTFYLYFKDKYELQDVLLAKTSHEFFANACKKANQHHFDRLDDKIVFIIDSIINELIDRPNILKFIQKNLSLGLYSEKLTDLLDSEEFFKPLIYQGACPLICDIAILSGSIVINLLACVKHHAIFSL